MDGLLFMCLWLFLYFFSSIFDGSFQDVINGELLRDSEVQEDCPRFVFLYLALKVTTTIITLVEGAMCGCLFSF